MQPASSTAGVACFSQMRVRNQNDKALAVTARLPAPVAAALDKDPDYLRTLAAIYQSQGRDADAQRVLVLALALAISRQRIDARSRHQDAIRRHPDGSAPLSAGHRALHAARRRRSREPSRVDEPYQRPSRARPEHACHCRHREDAAARLRVLALESQISSCSLAPFTSKPINTTWRRACSSAQEDWQFPQAPNHLSHSNSSSQASTFCATKPIRLIPSTGSSSLTFLITLMRGKA